MPTTSQKVPIPLPVHGVQEGVNPRLIGPSGLVSATNWIFRDGKFVTRDGLLPLGVSLAELPVDGIVNLVGTDELAEPNETFPFGQFFYAAGMGAYLNPDDPNEVWSYSISSVLDGPAEDDGYGATAGGGIDYDSYDDRWEILHYVPITFMTDYWQAPHITSYDDDIGYLNPYSAKLYMGMEDWEVGFPDFLGNEARDNFLLGTYQSTDVENAVLCSPFVEIPVPGDTYEIRLSVASTATAKYIKATPVSFKYNGTTDVYTPSEGVPQWVWDMGYEPTLSYVRSDYGLPIFHTAATETLAAPDWSDDNEFVVEINMSGFADHTHLGLFIEVEAEADATIAFGQLQIAYSTGNAYRLPSANPTLFSGTDAVSTFERPLGITQYDFDQSTIFTVMGTDKGWWKNNSNDHTWTDITDHDEDDELTGTNSSQVVFRTFDSSVGKVLLGVNGTDSLKVWNPDSVTDPDNYTEVLNQYPGLSHDSITAKAMAVTFNRIMMGNLIMAGIEYPDAIITTEHLAHDKWTSLSLTRLADTPGAITAIQEMGNQVTAIYKTDAIYTSQAQGGAIPFSYQLKAAHITGPASPLAVVPIDHGLHVYLAQDGDLVLFDGVRPRSLTATAHNHLQKMLDFKRIKEAFGMYNKSNKELYFIFPPHAAESTDDVDVSAGVMVSLQNPEMPTIWPLKYAFPITAGGYTYVNQSKLFNEETRLFRDVDAVWSSFARYTPNMLFGSAYPAVTGQIGEPEGIVYTQKGEADYHGDIKANLETGLFDLGEMTRYKTVKEIDHLMRTVNGAELDVLLKTYDYGSDDLYTDVDTVDLSAGPFISSHRLTGRLFALALDVDAPSQLEWLGSEASIHARGMR